MQSEIMEYVIWSCSVPSFSCRFLIPSLLSASLRQTNENARTAGNNPVWTLGYFSLMFEDDLGCEQNWILAGRAKMQLAEGTQTLW